IYGVKICRVPGVELSERICALAAQKGYRVFIYGAREEVNRRAAEVLQERFPAIRIAGRANGYLPEDQMGDLIDRINLSGAEILFVALGSPKQELWISRFREDLKTVRVCQGIGGTLDTLAGTVRRAPEFWCRWNGEWLYRLLAEPRRIKRQRVLPLFATQVIFLKFRNLMNLPA
ncbi:MAG: WecB/TagA/CpsF family glycosyltransferase, partial [Syntrophaceae bacterium]|nr:WecB/TagA/CpsF family glycosyltransferase [Syntrophaceae bacterium]